MVIEDLTNDAGYTMESDAAFALLTDVTTTLVGSGVDFVIVGGWVPVLFHAQKFGHPGTYAGEQLVFHVDFLNERNPGEELNLIGGSGKIKSIYTPAMEAVFKYAGYRTHPKLDGARFPSVETFIATKAMAARVKKRNRDAFDVFVTVADQDTSALRSRWRELMADGLFRDANEALWEAVHNEDALEKIGAVFDDLSTTSRPSEDEIRTIFDFLLEPHPK